MDAMSMFTTPNQFTYSAVDMGQLGATEYTLITALVDISGSVGSFKNELDKCLVTIVDACKKHPRSGNLLARVAMFNSAGIVEIHGFSMIKDINTSKYNVNPCGGTPLYDATLDAIETTGSYARTLTDQDYLVNGIFFVMTDGEENGSHIATVGKIKNAIEDLRQSETLESIKSILIGLGVSGTTSQYLQSFKDDAGFDEFVSIDDTTPGKLAKLAQWVSQSISSTSQALGSNGPSASVAFVI